MSSDHRQISDAKGYSTPSFFADIGATIVGLALVYGMITLVGNGNSVNEVKAEVQIKAPSAALSRLKATAKGQVAAFMIHKSPRPIPAFFYTDEQNKDHSLKEHRGKVVLLNIWATWCGPCRHEMPWLDSLQKKYGGKDFEMLTISIDRGGLKKPRRFFDQIKIKNLTLYGDTGGRLKSTMRIVGLPATFLIDREGREIGRINGPAEWMSKDAHAFIEAAIALGGGS